MGRNRETNPQSNRIVGVQTMKVQIEVNEAVVEIRLKDARIEVECFDEECARDLALAFENNAK
jgi:hypothetical protein